MNIQPDNAVGGRVTRSLRKRLTSVDSNQSNSRPGTPVAKLPTLPETGTASPRRTTRRNSVSTPNKTPVKATRGASLRMQTPEPKTPSKRSRLASLAANNEEAANAKAAQKKHVFEDLREDDEFIIEESPNKDTSPKQDQKSVKKYKEDDKTEKDIKAAKQLATLTPKVLISKKATTNTPLKQSPKHGAEKSQRVTRSQSKSPQMINVDNISPAESIKEDKYKIPIAIDEVITVSTDEEDNSNEEYVIRGRTVKMSDTIEPMDVDEDFHLEVVISDDENRTLDNGSSVKNNISIAKQSSEDPVICAPTSVEGTTKLVKKPKEAVENPKEANVTELIKKFEETNTPEQNKKDEQINEPKQIENLEENDVADTVKNPENPIEPIKEPNAEFEESEKSEIAPDSLEVTETTAPTKEPEETCEPDPNIKNADIVIENPNADLSEAAIVINEIKTLENITPVNVSLSRNEEQIVEPTVITEDKGRSVTFNDSAEDSPKVMYPKTPAPIKKKTLILAEILSDDSESDLSFGFSGSGSSLKDKRNKSRKVSIKNEKPFSEQKITKQDVSKTPHKSQFELTSVQSSTPIVKSDEQIVTSTVNNESIESTPNAEKKTGKSPGNSNVTETSLSKLWNRNVKGTVADKIDTIKAEKVEAQISETNKSDKNDHTADIQQLCNEDDDEAENEIARIKSEFVDDEALEAPDYESGDSMDSEERMEIAENEIIDHGESVESDEHSEENDLPEEDEEYERDSFLVSDSDNDDGYTHLDDGDSNDEMDKFEMKKPKRKRIIAHSSDEEGEEVANNVVVANDNSIIGEIIEIKVKSDKSDDEDEVSHNKARKSIRLNDSNSDIKLKSIDNDNEDVEKRRSIGKVRKSKNLNESASDSDNFETNKSIGDKKQAESFNLSYSHGRKNTSMLSKSVREKCDGLEDDNETAFLPFARGQESTGEQGFRDFIHSRYGRHTRDRSAVSKVRPIVSEEDVENNNASSEDNSHDEATPEPAAILKKVHGQLSVSFSNGIEKETRSGVRRHSFDIGVNVSTDTKNRSKELNISRLALINDNADTDESDANDETDENKQIVDYEEEDMVHQKKTSQMADYDDEGEAKTNSVNRQASEHSGDTWQFAQFSHMQKFFNPLQKSKRQSLYSPSFAGNEDEKQDDTLNLRRRRRRNDSQLNGNDFSPSQSLIETINYDELGAKRKRLSKSFFDAPDSLTQDFEERHQHKKLKIIFTENDNNDANDDDDDVVDDDDDVVDDDINDDDGDKKEESELEAKTTAATKAKVEPTTKVVSNDYEKVKSIMERCDDILEVANRAKLAQKLINKQSKVGLLKHRQVPIKRQHAIEENAPENYKSPPQQLKKDLKRLEKRSVPLKEAVKTSARLLTVDKPNAQEKKKKQKRSALKKPTAIVELTPPPSKRSKRQKHVSNVITSSASSTSSPTTTQSPTTSSDQENQYKQRIVGRVKTTAGYFIEGMATPKKKRRYIEEIQMPTGTMRVETVSPTLGHFREEPITPHYSAGQGKRRKGFIVSGGSSSSSNSKRAMEQWRVAEMGSSRHSKRSAATATEMAMKFKQNALEGKRRFLQRKF